MSANQSAAGFTPRLLAHSTFKSKIVAPTADIDITDWLLNIDELEYNTCTPRSKAHITAGFTHAPDGKRLSINVEFVAGALIVEHYVEDISEKLRCRVQSTSTSPHQWGFHHGSRDLGTDRRAQGRRRSRLLKQCVGSHHQGVRGVHDDTSHPVRTGAKQLANRSRSAQRGRDARIRGEHPAESA